MIAMTWWMWLIVIILLSTAVACVVGAFIDSSWETPDDPAPSPGYRASELGWPVDDEGRYVPPPRPEPVWFPTCPACDTHANVLIEPASSSTPKFACPTHGLLLINSAGEWVVLDTPASRAAVRIFDVPRSVIGLPEDDDLA